MYIEWWILILLAVMYLYQIIGLGREIDSLKETNLKLIADGWETKRRHDEEAAKLESDRAQLQFQSRDPGPEVAPGFFVSGA